MCTEDRVFVVVDPALAGSVEDLARRGHVWVVETPETEAIAERVWSEPEPEEVVWHPVGTTLFGGGETPEESLLLILAEVEIHHGPSSMYTPVDVISVLGARPSVPVRELLVSLGWSDITPTDAGFEARRRPAWPVLLWPVSP
jgi:hypothetical protein